MTIKKDVMESITDAIKAVELRNKEKGLPKFDQGQRVKICDKMPSCMSHFEHGVEAIVEYCYQDKYGSNDVDSWSLAIIGKDGKIRNTSAWYKTDQLTLVDDDAEKGLYMLQEYSGSNGRKIVSFV